MVNDKDELFNLAQISASNKGRDEVTEDDVALVAEILLTRIPTEQAKAFAFLILKDGKASTTDLMNSLQIPWQTAIDLQRTLSDKGLVNLEIQKLPTKWGVLCGYEMRGKGDFEKFIDDGKNKERFKQLLQKTSLGHWIRDLQKREDAKR